MLSNDCGYSLDLVSQKTESSLYRMLSAEIAYGHIGHLHGNYSGSANTLTDDLPAGLLTSYFMIRQLQTHYANEPVRTIRYHDGNGNLLPTDEAIPAGAIANNQVYVEYANGLRVYVNRNREKNWTVPHGQRTFVLPPDGWLAQRDDTLLEYSAIQGGRRVNCVAGPAYTYADGRGTETDFGPIRCTHAYLVRPENNALRLTPQPYLAAETVRLGLDDLDPKWGNVETVSVQSLAEDETVIDEQTVPLDADGHLPVPITAQAFDYRITPAP